jgi:hypothetical protein
MASAYKERLSGEANPNYRDAGIQKCGQCGNNFKSYADRVFCGKTCYDLFKASDKNPLRKQIDKSCLQCGSNFTTKPSVQDQSKYCSKHCSSKGTREVRRAAYDQWLATRETPRRFSKLYYTTCAKCESPITGRRRVKMCRKCIDDFRSPNTKNCSVCRSEFKSPASSSKTTCSRACSSTHRSESQRGENGPRWAGGKTSQALLVRSSAAYKDWRGQVFERDDYTCQMCGTRGHKLAAHHIKRFKTHPHLALWVPNGITLCWPCHRGIHHKESSFEKRFFVIVAARS